MSAEAGGLVDTHAHLMDPAFAADLEAVLARARAAGVTHMVCVGYDLPTSRAAVRLAAEHAGLSAAVGIHPNEAGSETEAGFEEIARLATAPGVVAVGETGLDYYRDRTARERQRTAFAWHLQLAERLHLPVVVHNREADDDVADLLEASAARRPADEPPGVLHCFASRDPRYLERMLQAGYYVSFAGPLTFKSAEELRQMAARVPRERLLVETDCPYLTPAPHRGARNEPAYVRHTAARLAEIVGADLPTLAAQVQTNCQRVFPRLAAEPRAHSKGVAA